MNPKVCKTGHRTQENLPVPRKCRFPAPFVSPELAGEMVKDHEAARSQNTRAAYRSAWRHFENWCKAKGLDTYTADSTALCAYLSSCARTVKVSTLQVRRAAIALAFRKAGLPNPWDHPTAREHWEGITRRHAALPVKKAPICREELRALLKVIPTRSLQGARDYALILLGFHGGFRRSELVAINVGHLTETDEGLTVRVPKSKTDQNRKGQMKGFVYQGDHAVCPIRALRSWIEAADITRGAVFRSIDRWGNLRGKRLSPIDVARIVKRYAKAAGLDPDRFAGHSLRAGLVTQARKDGAPDHVIMQQTGHKSAQTLREYHIPKDVLEDNVGRILRLGVVL